MNGEEVQQSVSTLFLTAQQNHRELMAAIAALTTKVDQMATSNQDVMNAIAAIPVASVGTALTQLSTDITTAISDMGSGGDTARAAMVTALNAVSTQLSAVATQIGTIDAGLVAAIAAATSPPATPAAPAA